MNMAMMMAMFGADMGAPQYLSVYYKRDNDKDWTLYNMYFTSSDIFFKAPYSGFYQLKFVGGGSSVDEFIGFCVPKGSIELVDEQDNDNLLAEYNGKTVNVDYDRVLAAEDNDGSFTPKAYTVCLPYEFSINEYYEQGRVGLYQLDCIDQYYGQYVFQQVDDIIKPGQAYLAVVERDSIQFDAIDATITNENQQGVPVHDFGNWYQNGTLTELGMWQGVIKPIAVTEGETHNNIFMMDDEGNWNKLADDMTARAFRACFIANSDAFGESDKTSPDSAFARKATRDASWTFSTKFFKRNKDGQEEVVDIPNLLYKGDIRGGAGDTNGITPTIVTIDRDGTKNYYDLQGRRLSGKPDKGIYIVNGKKHMAR